MGTHLWAIYLQSHILLLQSRQFRKVAGGQQQLTASCKVSQQQQKRNKEEQAKPTKTNLGTAGRSVKAKGAIKLEGDA